MRGATIKININFFFFSRNNINKPNHPQFKTPRLSVNVEV